MPEKPVVKATPAVAAPAVGGVAVGGVAGAIGGAGAAKKGEKGIRSYK